MTEGERERDRYYEIETVTLYCTVQVNCNLPYVKLSLFSFGDFNLKIPLTKESNERKDENNRCLANHI